MSLNALAVGLWLARSQLAGPRLGLLLWNLFLAAVPWVLSLTLRGTRPVLLYGAVLAGWLAFFPNAPYLVTDFVHLAPRPPVPLWFDVLFFSSFALAGCALGWDSLARVQQSLTLRLGRPAATLAVGTAIGLCGFGVFLGRFARLNSWDVVTAPAEVLQVSLAALTSPRALLFSCAFSAFVGAGYLFSTPPLTAGK